MKILIVANTTWYVHNFRTRLILSLIDQGYQVTVLSPMDHYVDSILSSGACHLNLTLDNAGTNPFKELLTLFRIVTKLRQVRPSLILTYTPKINIYVSLAAKVMNIPVIANVSGLGSGFISGGALKATMLGLYRLAFTHPNIVFFQNADDLTEFARMGLVNESRTRLIPGSGVDLRHFVPSHRQQDGKVIFLMVSRLLRDKGVGEFVQAARQLKRAFPHTEFQLLGPLDKQNPSAIPLRELEQWVADGIINYLGTSDDVRNFYRRADCVVLPSYREGCPRSLLEAASMAKPIITTDAPGCRNL